MLSICLCALIISNRTCANTQEFKTSLKIGAIRLHVQLRTSSRIHTGPLKKVQDASKSQRRAKAGKLNFSSYPTAVAIFRPERTTRQTVRPSPFHIFNVAEAFIGSHSEKLTLVSIFLHEMLAAPHDTPPIQRPSMLVCRTRPVAHSIGKRHLGHTAPPHTGC
jgi:hypothetical protein